MNNTKKVLIAEDERWIRMGLKKQIEWGTLNLEIIHEVDNGKKALEFLRETEIDILITDIHMPVMDGFELMEVMQMEYPNVAVIILSGYTEFEYARRAVTLNVVEYVVKPIEKCVMTKALNRAINRIDNQKLEKERKESFIKEKKVFSDFKTQIELTNFFMGNTPNIDEISSLFGEFVKLKGNTRILSIIFGNFYEIVEKEYEYEYEYLSEKIIKTIKSVLTNKLNFMIVANVIRKDEIIVAISSNEDEREWHEEIRKSVDTILYNLKNLFSLTTYIGIGGEYPEIDGIRKSYSESYEAAKTAHMYNKEGLADQEKFCVDLDCAAQIDKILKYIEIGNEKLVIKAINEFFNQIISSKYIKVKEFKRIITEILIKIDITVQKMNLSIIELENYKSLYNTLAGDSYNFSEIRMYLNDLVYDIIDLKNKEIKNNFSSTIPEVNKYIQNNFRSGINLSNVATVFHVTPSYLSRIFKNETGCNFNKYINKLKMEEATKLIENGKKCRLEDIAYALGYDNPEYFLKKFKQFYLCTPTEYKTKNFS